MLIFFRDFPLSNRDFTQPQPKADGTFCGQTYVFCSDCPRGAPARSGNSHFCSLG